MRATTTSLAKVLTRIFLNKIILDNADLMKKAGRILAVDTLIGNTDRFEGGSNGMNIGNAFFYSKTYQDRQQREGPQSDRCYRQRRAADNFGHVYA